MFLTLLLLLSVQQLVTATTPIEAKCDCTKSAEYLTEQGTQRRIEDRECQRIRSEQEAQLYHRQIHQLAASYQAAADTVNTFVTYLRSDLLAARQKTENDGSYFFSNGQETGNKAYVQGLDTLLDAVLATLRYIEEIVASTKSVATEDADIPFALDRRQSLTARQYGILTTIDFRNTVLLTFAAEATVAMEKISGSVPPPPQATYALLRRNFVSTVLTPVQFVTKNEVGWFVDTPCDK